MRGLYIGNNRLLVYPLWGGKLIALADDLSISPDLAIHGLIEPPLTKFFLQEVKAGQTVVDVGANIGYYSVLFGHLVGRAGRVFAYEANPHIIPILMDNLSVNYLHEWCRVINKAAYSSEGTIVFHCSKRFVGNSSIHKQGEEYFENYVDNIETVEVPSEPLDSLLDHVQHVDLIKIDIEGGEYHALLGMQQLLRKAAVRTVVFELNKQMLQGDWDGLFEILYEVQDECGFSFYTLSDEGTLVSVDLSLLRAQGSNPHVVMRRRTTMDGEQ